MPLIILSLEIEQYPSRTLSSLRAENLISLSIHCNFVLAFAINLMDVSQLTLDNKGQEFNSFL